MVFKRIFSDPAFYWLKHLPYAMEVHT